MGVAALLGEEVQHLRRDIVHQADGGTGVVSELEALQQDGSDHLRLRLRAAGLGRRRAYGVRCTVDGRKAGRVARRCRDAASRLWTVVDKADLCFMAEDSLQP